jgi:endo-1,4-beta-D-glucanase Y
MPRNTLYFAALILCFTFFINKSNSAILPFSTTLPSVSQSYDSILLKTWAGIKKRNIDAYSIPLVHRPKSELPGDAVSEGVGYGLFCALYCNDQTYFNKIWDAAEKYMWSGSAYNWRVNSSGAVIGTGPAADAEEDIACALIFASLLVNKGAWQAHSSSNSVTYAARAKIMVEYIWNSLVENGKYLRPGNKWGGSAFVNPGYFAPAFYRIFEEFDSTSHDWSGLIDQCYKSVDLSPGFANGLVPDWMRPDGNYTDSAALGYNSYASGKYCYKDGIRILWRLATDYMWYSESRAKTFLDKSYAFIKTPSRANFFKMDGSAVTDTFTLGNGVSRKRTEHSHLTVAMWATAALASGGTVAADSFSNELMEFYTSGADFFGKVSDTGNEDTLHNEMYFDQFLAWFGASLMSGVFTDLWEDFKDTNSGVALQWKSRPTFSSSDIDANVNPLKISGIFNKSARWTVKFSQHGGDSTVRITGVGDTLSVVWYGLSSACSIMPTGWYDISITAKGLADSISGTCWLGRPLDLIVDKRLLVDDFRDLNFIPFIGTLWESYLDSYEGKSGKSTVPVFTVNGSDTSAYLRWSFFLNGSSVLGYNPYAALEWNCETSDSNINLTGLDTIIIMIKAASALTLSVQLITSDITDYNYFEDSISLTKQWQTLTLPIKSFKHRFSGSSALDLAKLTAIRFQIQNKDSTTNEIQLKKMLFSGSLTTLYQSPSAYITSGIKKNNITISKYNDNFRITGKNNSRVNFYIPAQYRHGNLLIVDIKGKEVRRLSTDADIVAWNGLDSNKCHVIPGIYFAIISGQGGICRIKVPVVK